MIDWQSVTVPLIVAVGSLVALMVDAFLPRRSWAWPCVVAVASLVVAGGELVRSGESDDVSAAFSMIILAATLLVVLMAAAMDHEDAMPPGELHFLLLASASGALCLVVARDLATLVVALELLSIPSIALVGLRRGDAAAARSAWTFFLVSALATAVSLMGVSLVYGFTGTLRYAEVGRALGEVDAPASAVSSAVLVTVVGLVFKVGAVPFHMWIPDTYRGASVPVAAYLSVVSKTGAFAGLMLVLAVPLVSARDAWAPFVAVLAAVTMLVGNVGALAQRDAVGLLAWSSIAQSGTIMAALVALPAANGLVSPIRYLAIYSLANLVAFTAVTVVQRSRGRTDLAAFTGLVRGRPVVAGCLMFALLSLAGFPPAVIGLLAKYLVLVPVIQAGYGWLAVVLAVSVAIGLVYYLRFVVVIVSKTPEGEQDAPSPSPPYAVRIASGAMLVGTLALVAASVAPNLVVAWLP